MRKALVKTFGVLVCFAIISFFAIPTFVEGMESSTNVDIIVQDFVIISQTEDCVLNEGDDLELMVSASQTPKSYLWQTRANENESWSTVSILPTYQIQNAQPNNPATTPYQYRVTVTSSSGETDSAIIYVLVSDDYSYRMISLRNGDTDVSSYMHRQTRLVVTPLSDSSTAATVLEAELSDDCLPLILCDVSLVNQDSQVVPYFGALQVDFHVGSTYNGQTLKAYHLIDGDVVTYSGVVDNGILSIIVNRLSPFMVEVPATNTQTVTVSAGTGGSVTPSGTINVADGTDKTFTFLPDAGYAIDEVLVNDVPVTFTGNSYTIRNITENMTIVVSFREVAPSKEFHTVTASSDVDGRISPSGTMQVRHGSAQSFYFYPDANHELDTVLVNGVEVNVIGSSYTLSAVEDNTTVYATFHYATTQPPDAYKTISADAGKNGSISPAGNISVEYGGGLYFYFIPNDGYEVDKVFIDGTATAVSGNCYHFINVIGDRTIRVTFKKIITPPKPIYHTITANSGANGTIAPAGAVKVLEGGRQSFSFIPNTGYKVDTVTVDGKTLKKPGTSYIFSNVKRNHTIRVTYKRTAMPSPHAKDHTNTDNSGVNVAVAPAGAVKTPNEESQTIYHTISVFAEGNGSITPSGKVQVASGGSQIFYLTADDGYEVEAIYLNGEKQDVVGSQFAVDNITGDMELRGIFKPKSSSASKGDSHCFICKYFDRNIAPWCRIIPLLIIIVLVVGFWFAFSKRRKKQ